ncbi:MAG: hypothetical protein ACLGI6_23365, partial [Gammaproteobacteria bacterium]
FGPGPVVAGPRAGGLTDAHASAREALAGLRAAPGRPDSPYPVDADDLLPERALGGDPADVLIADGVIAGIGTGLDAGDAHVVAGAGLIALPGLVDLHTHLREPGGEESETVATGSAAAALGARVEDGLAALAVSAVAATTGEARGFAARRLVAAARRAAGSGASTVIAWGREPDVLLRLAAGERIGTALAAATQKLAARKQWMADHLQLRGAVVVDEGAASKLRHGGKSLLPIGVVMVE